MIVTTRARFLDTQYTFANVATSSILTASTDDAVHRTGSLFDSAEKSEYRIPTPFSSHARNSCTSDAKIAISSEPSPPLFIFERRSVRRTENISRCPRSTRIEENDFHDELNLFKSIEIFLLFKVPVKNSNISFQ